MRLLALVSFLLMVGCSNNITNFVEPQRCPHPWRDVVKAGIYLQEVNFVEFPDPRQLGMVTYDGKMYISKYLGPSGRRKAMEHELCHLYRMRILNIPMQDEYNHKDWYGNRF